MNILAKIDGYKQAVGLVLVGVGNILTYAGVADGETVSIVGWGLAGVGAADKARKTYQGKDPGSQPPKNG